MKHKTTCTACRKRITSASYITDLDDVFCSQCIDSDGLHRQLWPHCEQLWHLPIDHLAGIENRRK